MIDPQAILDAYLDDELTADQHRQLVAWIDRSPENIDRLVKECRLDSYLQEVLREEQIVSDAVVISQANDFFVGGVPQETVGYLSSGWPVAYLIATMIFGLGLLIASHVYVSRPVQVARQPSMPGRVNAEVQTEFAGRITGMVDCKWETKGLGIRDWGLEEETAGAGRGAGGRHIQSLIPNPQSTVSLGDKFALSSGLMEITYNSGAKVILQGPVTYEVESRTGGFISIGKLTARLEKKAEGSNPQSPIPNPLFVVRTPTATVTDLGTEFGVEVSKEGITETHVFLGRVKLVGCGDAGHVPEQILLAGQAERLGPRVAAAPIFKSRQKQFVRTMPAPEPTVPRELIGRVDYSDTWTANSPTRAGSYLPLTDPEALQVEQCHGNPPRRWVFSKVSSMTTWPLETYQLPWPGCKVPGSKSGFTETGYTHSSYFGFEYGLRNDLVVQFDAVQTDDRMNITIGDDPATIGGARSLSVFFRAPGTGHPEIAVYTPTKKEADTGLRSGVLAPWQWHNYAVRFNLPEKRLTVWVDRQCRGTIDLASITRGMEREAGRTWASLPWSGRCVSVGGHSNANERKVRIWTDNFRVGSPTAADSQSKQKED